MPRADRDPRTARPVLRPGDPRARPATVRLGVLDQRHVGPTALGWRRLPRPWGDRRWRVAGCPTDVPVVTKVGSIFFRPSDGHRLVVGWRWDWDRVDVRHLPVDSGYLADWLQVRYPGAVRLEEWT